jgi:NADPH-dependent 2,4-dienoyl-CoA reductase/sulfur reductase-like enzyme
MADLEHVVVVGASAAGLSAVDGLREAGFDGTITVLGAERHPPYDRPTLSKAALLLSEGEPELLELRTPERLQAARLDLRLGHAAVGLDVDRRYVVTTDGDALPWDAVVIACGSRPRELHTAEGQVLPVLRTPDDLCVLRQAAARYGEISVIGAGFIGLEIAAGLIGHGAKVTVFADTPLPLEAVLGDQVAEAVRDLHLTRGVNLRAATTVQAVTGGPGAYALQLLDGTVHRTPFVIVGIGVDPDVDWLVGSGVDLDRGVVTDAAGRANVSGVWAAGDVAAFEHPLLGERVRVEHWTHAIGQGRHVGLNIARGVDTSYAGVPYFWTDQYERRFEGYGWRRPGDEVVVAEGSLTDDEFLVLHGGNGELHAAFASGKTRSLRGYRKLLERRGGWDDAIALARSINPELDQTARVGR